MQNKQTDHVHGVPYSVPRERSRWPSLGLALAMHLGLLFFLWVGVNWQSTEPVAVEAEVWDLKVQTAAPPPEVATEPDPQPAPPPQPAVEEPAPPPPPPPVAAPEPKVDLREAEIALERKKAKLKEEKEKAAEEARKKQEQQDREDAKREQDKQKQKEKEKADKLEKEKADKLEKAKQAKEKALAEEKAEAQAQKDKEQKEQAEKKAAAEKAAKAKKAAEQKAADKARADEMSRITGAVGSGTTGTAAKATAPRMDSGYVAAITTKIKSNIAYSGSTDIPGAPRAVYKIDQLPTGEIISVRKIKSSGLPAYDNAVENAIKKSSPLPKKKDGTVEREIEAVFDMKDLPK